MRIPSRVPIFDPGPKILDTPAGLRVELQLMVQLAAMRAVAAVSGALDPGLPCHGCLIVSPDDASDQLLLLLDGAGLVVEAIVPAGADRWRGIRLPDIPPEDAGKPQCVWQRPLPGLVDPTPEHAPE